MRSFTICLFIISNILLINCSQKIIKQLPDSITNQMPPIYYDTDMAINTALMILQRSFPQPDSYAFIYNDQEEIIRSFIDQYPLKELAYQLRYNAVTLDSISMEDLRNITNVYIPSQIANLQYFFSDTKHQVQIIKYTKILLYYRLYEALVRISQENRPDNDQELNKILDDASRLAYKLSMVENQDITLKTIQQYRYFINHSIFFDNVSSDE